MIGMASKETAKSANREKSKKTKFAGIRFKDKGGSFIKTKNVQLAQFKLGWDCSVLCLLHSGPRIYTGPL
jgi:hypothetical protein